MNVVAAVDCGATSVRVCRIDLDAVPLVPEVVHRVPHAPVPDSAGHLRWDWRRICAAVVDGLERCLERGPLASIGVDTWAVDYGLLDEDGRLVGAPYSYRDQRTNGYRSIVDQVGAMTMFRDNGLQIQPFNTVFQLARHDRAELRRAARLLWLPELIVHHLTGVAVTERTSAGSSGLVEVSSGDWSSRMLDVASIDRSMVGDIESAGRIVGAWRGVPVTLVGGHDTASAVIGMGTSTGSSTAFVSSGTWMLVGVERSAPDVSSWALTHGFTNESGALGGFRFLRNVTGFWLLEQCRRSWGDVPMSRLIDDAVAVETAPLVAVDHESLRSPSDMLTAYTRLAGLPRDAPAGRVTRSIVDSIAAATADVIGRLRSRSPIDDIVLFGGAARNPLFVARLERRIGAAVRIGPAEAAALGNAIVQGIALGRFSSVADGRRRVGRPPRGDVHP